MYIKVCPQNTGDHYMFECERYTFGLLEDGKLTAASNNTYVFPQEQEKYNSELWLYKGDDFIAHLVCSECVVYIMSDEGKTIDTIWT